MGWFWGRGDSEASTSSDDITKRVDPKLRDVLDNEKFTTLRELEREDKERRSQRWQRSVMPSKPSEKWPEHSPNHRGPSSSSPASSTSSPAPNLQNDGTKPDQPVVPAETLFPDGRYAHLWKTYKPNMHLAYINTEQDQLRDLVDVQNDRKSDVKKAAKENCVMELLAMNECLTTGGFKSTMTMCRAEEKQFYRCFTMQIKFLTALGYMTERGRDPDLEEQIQMHADSLYHRMLEHEKLAAEARERGEPEPAVVPVMARENLTRALNGAQTSMASSSSTHPTQKLMDQRKAAAGASSEKRFPTMFPTPTSWSPPPSQQDPSSSPSSSIPMLPSYNLEDIPEGARHELKKRLEGRTAEERALELRLFEAELHEKIQIGRVVVDIFEEERKTRARRRERNAETIGDRMKRWWGWK